MTSIDMFNGRHLVQRRNWRTIMDLISRYRVTLRQNQLVYTLI